MAITINDLHTGQDAGVRVEVAWGQQDIFGGVEYPAAVPFYKHPLGKKRRMPTRANGYAARPGTGPEGEKCKTCAHKYANEMRSGKVFWKCQLMRHCWTGGTGTDIRVNSPACSRWCKA